jgi:hypothetical protein
VSLTGTFLVLILYFLGGLWSNLLPRGDRLAEKWKGKQGKIRNVLLRIITFINPGPFGLKEHAIAAITASSSANAYQAIEVFTVQEVRDEKACL